ncbi:hypothetical protein PVAP13_1NG117000 [Panicum virgatum]|uniref:Uncharacterized protein n=1 Tax=Panicum virgatum TaxID=38727 RepID=A0A8T0WQG3_PANVG|nr:hypothetical protein PVAP13_1NG117000 [Panicum virgatum]
MYNCHDTWLMFVQAQKTLVDQSQVFLSDNLRSSDVHLRNGVGTQVNSISFGSVRPKAHEVSQREEREGIRRVCLASVRPIDDPAAEITQILHRTPTALKHSGFCSTDLSFIPQYGNVHVPNCKREQGEHRWHVRAS